MRLKYIIYIKFSRKDEIDATSNKVASSIKLFDVGNDCLTTNTISRPTASNKSDADSVAASVEKASNTGIFVFFNYSAL